MSRPRRNPTAAIKAKAALAALKGDRTLAELAEKYDVRGSQITQSKTQLREGAIDELHLECPFLGARQLRKIRRREGHPHAGRLHIGTLMAKMGITALYRKPNTSKRHPAHKIYPYLLRRLAIERAKHVGAMDITYLPMQRGFIYLTAVMDWATRRVLTWRVSNTLTADFCVEAVEEAIGRYGKPEIFNTDQGS